MKKTSKGDKKKKKEVAVEVAKLEAQLEELSLQKKQQQNELKEKSCAEGAAPEVSAPKKLSKAQRRKVWPPAIASACSLVTCTPGAAGREGEGKRTEN